MEEVKIALISQQRNRFYVNLNALCQSFSDKGFPVGGMLAKEFQQYISEMLKAIGDAEKIDKEL